MQEFVCLTKALVTCCFLSWITLAAESVVLKSLSTRSASECCTVCGQTETCQGVSYEEQTNVCEIRGSLEEIPDWVLVSGRDTTVEAVKVHHFVKECALLAILEEHISLNDPSAGDVIHVISCYSDFCKVIEYQCVHASPLCGHYLVSGEHGVSDDQLTASTEFNGDHGPDRGRLFSAEALLPDGTRVIGAWVAGVQDINQYIQVQFSETRVVTGIATQGRELYNILCCYNRVTQYRAMYSGDCTTFYSAKNSGGNEVFPGNTDKDSVVTNILDSPVLAKCVRIHPVA